MSASTFAHMAAAQALSDTLHLGDVDAFHSLSVILRAKLTPAQRWWLAWAFLRVCDDDEAEGVAEAVLGPLERPVEGAGTPRPPFLDLVAEAVFWASILVHEERRAYAMACLAHMAQDEREAIVAALRGRAAA